MLHRLRQAVGGPQSDARSRRAPACAPDSPLATASSSAVCTELGTDGRRTRAVGRKAGGGGGGGSLDGKQRLTQHLGEPGATCGAVAERESCAAAGAPPNWKTELRGPAMPWCALRAVTQAGLQYMATLAGLLFTVSSTSGTPRPGSLVAKLYTCKAGRGAHRLRMLIASTGQSALRG